MKVEVHWGERIEDDKYHLTGKDVKSVKQELDARDEWGNFDGSIGYDFDDTAKGIVTKVRLLPRYKITMPNWPAYRKQPQSVKENWDAMYKALIKHENKHKQILLTGLIRVENYLSTLGKISKNDFKTKIENQLKEIEKKKVEFDKETENGAARGVVLSIPSEEK